ncbi:hypothetical protein MAR_021064, partial [Mya arenaria]
MRICDTLIKGANSSFPKRRFKRFLKPYWSESLTKEHMSMWDACELWRRAGRPRVPTDVMFVAYKSAKRKFRLAQRWCIEEYLATIDNTLEHIAKTDPVWKTVNSRRKLSISNSGAGINFNGAMYRDRERSNLYFPSQSQDFDDDWKEHVSRTVQNAFDNIKPEPDAFVSEKMRFKRYLKCKACGSDGILYEHLIYGRAVIAPVLADMFTCMLRLSHIPVSMKIGTITTMHKGGNKRKDDPNNYRAITLVVVFEILILQRCKDQLLTNIDNQQGGFQEQLGCLMSSFALRERLLFAREHSSTVYLCFLDGRILGPYTYKVLSVNGMVPIPACCFRSAWIWSLLYLQVVVGRLGYGPYTYQLLSVFKELVLISERGCRSSM